MTNKPSDKFIKFHKAMNKLMSVSKAESTFRGCQEG